MATEWGDNKDITYFGKTNFRSTNQVFGIRRKDRRQHMYVLGKSGTGKSVLLSNLIIQNIKNGEGVCVIDPHGELVQEILASIPPERVKDTIYFNPGDIDYHVGFNVLELEDVNYKHLVASGIMGIFTKIWANAWSSRMEYILNNAILALLDTPGSTLLGIPRLLVDKDYRQSIIANLKDPVVKAFWVHEYEAWRDQFRNEAIAPIQNKVGQFLSTSIVRNVVGQSKSTIDIFDIMNSGKIFLVNVSKGRVGEDNSALLGGMLITKIQLAAMERVRIPESERKDFYLYVDEFQNFVTDSFANILSEARKYRLNLTIAHQYVGQLETESGAQVRDAVFGNVGTMIVFRVGAPDADFLEKEFEPEFTPQDLVNLPNYHIYLKLMVDGIASRPFSASTLPPIQVEHSEEIVKKVIETSRALYMRPKKEVEEEITRWSSAAAGKVDENSLDSNGDKQTMSQTTGGKFDAKCSSCGKDIKVPFEPQSGRPVYCRECLEKIKSGEISPVLVSGPKTKQMEARASDALASLGIEFVPSASQSPVRNDKPLPPKPVVQIIEKKPEYIPPVKKVEKVEQKMPEKKVVESVGQTQPPLNKPVVPSNTSMSQPDKKQPTVSGIANAIQSALSGIGLNTKPVQPKPKVSIPLASLKASVPLSNSVNTKIPTEKNMSALKGALALAMKEHEKEIQAPVVSQSELVKKDEQNTTPFVHHEAVAELADIDRLHQDFSTRITEKENKRNQTLEIKNLPVEPTIVQQSENNEQVHKAKVEEYRREMEQAEQEAIEKENRKKAELLEQQKREEIKKKEEEEALKIVREKERLLAEQEAWLKQQEYEKQQKNTSQNSQTYTPRQPTEVPEDVLRKVLE